MCRNRLLLLVAALVVAALLVGLWLWIPTPAPVEHAPPPVAKRPEPPLQADAEGYYVPGYRFTVNRFRFRNFSLRPDAVVTFARTTSGTRQPLGCPEAVIKPDRFHLRCEDPEIGTVTIEGRFLARYATSRLDAPVASAVVTVRSGSGEILYSARDSFVWQPRD